MAHQPPPVPPAAPPPVPPPVPPPPAPAGPSRWRDQPAAASSVSDWVSDLLWPRVLRSAAYGLRAGRLGLGFFAVVIAALLLGIGTSLDRWFWGPREPWMPDPAASWPWRAYLSLPYYLVQHWPVTTLVFLPVLLATWLVLLGAVSRLTACEIAQGRFLSWWEGLAFAVARWKSMLGAVLGPLVVVWLIILALAFLGWVFLSLRWVNVVGGVFYIFPLFAGLLAAGLLAIYILGHNLLIPAVVCEGADAIDSVQRAYAYALARPVRLIIYLALGIISVVVVVGLVSLVVLWGIEFSMRATAHWASPEGQATVVRGTQEAVGDGGLSVVRLLPGGPLDLFSVAPSGLDRALGPELPRTWGSTAELIRFWTLIPLVALAGVWLSCGMSAATMVYLAIRRVCDGQDVGDIWWPGTIERAMSESMAARAAAAPAAAGFS
jgi:hypothetical protein